MPKAPHRPSGRNKNWDQYEKRKAAARVEAEAAYEEAEAAMRKLLVSPPSAPPMPEPRPASSAAAFTGIIPVPTPLPTSPPPPLWQPRAASSAIRIVASSPPAA